MKDERLRILKDMLYEEENPNRVNYGATLSHWYTNEAIDIDAAALRVLIKHYEHEAMIKECEQVQKRKNRR